MAQAHELSAAARDQTGRGTMWDSGGDMLAKQSESIQAKLDAVIADLDAVTAPENWNSGEDHLPQLTAALRIWRSSAPDETRKTEIGWAVRERMLLAYCEMGSSRKFKSKTRLLTEVGEELGISRVTAGRHWNAYLASDSRQRAWAEGIEANTKRKPPSKRALAKVARDLGIDAPQDACTPARKLAPKAHSEARSRVSKGRPDKGAWFRGTELSKRKSRSG